MLKLSNLESIGKPVYKFQNNHSVDFDGVDDFIELGEPISYTQHTISTWVKISDTSDVKTIIDARDASDDGIRIRTDANEQIIYEVNTSDIFTSDSFVDVWTHIVATYDGTTQKLYINGSLVSSATTSQTVDVTTNARIGARNFSTRANEFAGKIDELAIYDRALEEEEVTKIYRIKYGANLVQNGNFDELGSELVTNGDFATDSDWNNNVGNDWQITNGQLILTTTSSNNVNQAIGLVQNKVYKIVFTVSNTTSGGVRVRLGTGSFTSVLTDGTHTLYLEQTTTNDAFRFYANSSGVFNGQIDNVSVKQVDPNDRFTLGTGWSYGDSIASSDGSQTGNSSLSQSSALPSASGKTYKITFTIVNYVSGGVEVYPTNTTVGTYPKKTANGTFTRNVTVTSASPNDILYIQADSSFIGSVTNVMVEEQKYVATNLKLNSIPYSSSNLRNYYRFGDGILDTHPLICDMVQPSLGSNLVLNGTFETAVTTDEWTNFGTPTTSERSTTYAYEGNVSYHIVSDAGKGIFATASQFNGDYAVGDIVKVQAFVYPITATSNQLKSGLNNSDRAFNTTVTGLTLNQWNKIEYYVRIVTATNNYLTFLSAGAGNEFYLDNVSTQVVNGVPGFMTNMTEADITNDVPS